MDADMDEANFELNISLDSGSQEPQVEEIDMEKVDDNELSKFVSNLENRNVTFCDETNSFVPLETVADDIGLASNKSTEKQPKKKVKRFEECKENDCDEYANESVAPLTQKQTVWAVKIFKGT